MADNSGFRDRRSAQEVADPLAGLRVFFVAAHQLTAGRSDIPSDREPIGLELIEPSLWLPSASPRSDHSSELNSNGVSTWRKGMTVADGFGKVSLSIK